MGGQNWKGTSGHCLEVKGNLKGFYQPSPHQVLKPLTRFTLSLG